MAKDGAPAAPGLRIVPLRTPPGRMGLLFQFVKEGPSLRPVVAKVEGHCPFWSKVKKGDRLLSISGLAVTTPAQLRFRSGWERELVFARPEPGPPGPGAKSERKEKGPGASSGGAPAAAKSEPKETRASSRRAQVEKWSELRFQNIPSVQEPGTEIATKKINSKTKKRRGGGATSAEVLFGIDLPPEKGRKRRKAEPAAPAATREKEAGKRKGGGAPSAPTAAKPKPGTKGEIAAKKIHAKTNAKTKKQKGGPPAAKPAAKFAKFAAKPQKRRKSNTAMYPKDHFDRIYDAIKARERGGVPGGAEEPASAGSERAGVAGAPTPPGAEGTTAPRAAAPVGS